MANNRPKMPISDRAKQFLPFAAVRGLEEALERKRQELLFEERVVLANEGEREVNEALEKIEEGDTIRVRYYNGRNYEEETGIVLKEDVKKRYLQTETAYVSFDDILRIEILGE